MAAAGKAEEVRPPGTDGVHFAGRICTLQGCPMMPELKTVDHVDVARYMGTWYEIAKFPQRFEKGLVGVTADYTLLPNGKVQGPERRIRGDFNGKLRSAKGKAWIVDRASNAKLKVSFFWPFAADYWILELGNDYEYSAVGEPVAQISLDPVQDAADGQRRLRGPARTAKRKGFDVSRLEKNPQK